MLNRQIFSYQQKEYVTHSLIENMRIDGRQNSQYRKVNIKHSLLQHIPGSSYAQIQYDNIEIYVGVKAKILSKIYQTSQIYLQFTCMQKLDQDEVQLMQNMKILIKKNYINTIGSNLDLTEDLKITNSVEHSLGLYIDIFLLSSPHFSQLQIIQRAIKVALQNTKIPNLQAIINQNTKQQRVQLLNNFKSLNMTLNKHVRIFIIGNIEGNFISDMRAQQYEAVTAVMLVVVNQGQVVNVQLLKGQINASLVNKCVSYAISQAENNKQEIN